MFTGYSFSRRFVPLAFAVFLASAPYVSAEPLRIGFLCPKPPAQGFWSEVIEVMQAAALDLDIELQVKCDRSSSTLGGKRLGERLLNSEPRLDYFITGYWSSVTKHHLELARKRGIKVFIFNADIKDIEADEIGKPRGKYKNWIGHMVPDDKAAAMQQTKILINQAAGNKNKTAANPVNIYAFLGTGISPVARRRIAGLREQVELMPTAKLFEVSITVEDRRTRSVKIDMAREWATKLITNSSVVDAFWTGNQDEMWGALEGIEQSGKAAGEDVFVGGFDWNPESIKAIEDGQISVSMFGHFMEGAWALLLAHDHHYGFDFADDVGVKISTTMVAITPQNYQNYKVLVGDNFWEGIDFKQFSKKYNPALKTYNFDIGQFLK